MSSQADINARIIWLYNNLGIPGNSDLSRDARWYRDRKNAIRFSNNKDYIWYWLVWQ